MGSSSFSRHCCESISEDCEYLGQGSYHEAVLLGDQSLGGSCVNCLTDARSSGSSLFGPDSSYPSRPTQAYARQAEARSEALKQHVVSFLKELLQGDKQVTYLLLSKDGKTIQRLHAIMGITPDLSKIVFQADGQDIKCPLANLEDVYDIDSDGTSAFPPRLLNILPPQDWDRLLRLHLTWQKGEHSQSFYMLEATPEAKDDFLASIKMLCACARSLESEPERQSQ
mmetsp:Transcript_62205/g.131463  ORF Transcript_62205/g.131463 Transcript_62205/m.131463 type:complete len:226 (+) Transcript_62205:598-1275(+)|eukprot:CAMPEP_0206424768 /NCGR_PEP_ID=MMETSP0324_2-20121206/3417_1 /ASSEMBLY_ACC=CAM_ASM_000836 /TAXON_ID=2866 /ORGANISM="Crypthecodinium cohnii, Strain Seligo" /LENGTH=225 /DNA_ID=CAMNT_0053889471 /DNA_START=831 /DNA_END=1508 /DNA_ORIENTATION=-